MHIAIIGAGRVGATLGRRWVGAGHQVSFGVRTPDDPRHAELSVLAGIDVTGIAAATVAADVVVLATPYGAVEDALDAAGDLRGKVVVDATNPIAEGMAGLLLGTTTSGAEQVAAHVPGAHVVKAFNTTGAGNMADPGYPGGAIVMPVAGDDDEAKAVVMGLASDLGFEPVDLGPLVTARYLEPLAMVWITLAFARGLGPDMGLVLVRR